MSDMQSASSPGFTGVLGNKVGGIHLQFSLLGDRGSVILPVSRDVGSCCIQICIKICSGSVFRLTIRQLPTFM